MIYIRKYKPEDKQQLRKICIETSSLPTETESQRKFLTLMYNDYYTEVEPENCFVAVDEDDIPMGYIICSENFDSYLKIMKNFYLPEIKSLGFNFLTMSLGEIGVHKLFSKKYKAHLHIDILDVCQGKGVGTSLMNALKDHLSEKNIHSIMLSCGMGNTRAIGFYKKNKFKIIRNVLGSCIMACDF